MCIGVLTLERSVRRGLGLELRYGSEYVGIILGLVWATQCFYREYSGVMLGV